MSLFLLVLSGQSCSSKYQHAFIDGKPVGFQVGQVYVSKIVAGFDEYRPDGIPQGIIGIIGPRDTIVPTGTKIEVIGIQTGYSGTFGKNTEVLVRFKLGELIKLARLSGTEWAEGGPKLNGYDRYLVPSSSLVRVK